MKFASPIGFTTCLAACLLAAAPLAAQLQIPTAQQLQDFGQAGGVSASDGPVVKVQGVFGTASGSAPARLYVTSEIAKGWHIYSITMGKGGPIATSIRLTDSPEFKITGAFKAHPLPETHTYPDIFGPLPVEEHTGRVIWYAPIELAAGVDPAKLKIDGKVRAQACDASNCLPPESFSFTATMGTPPKVPEEKAPPPPAEVSEPPADAKIGVYTHPASHATLRGEATPKVAAPGDTVRIAITVEPSPEWHVYSLGQKPPVVGSKPTLIHVSAPAGWQVGEITANQQAHDPAAGSPDGSPGYYDGTVRFTAAVQVPAGTPPGDYTLEGLMGYQTCRDTNCDLPRAVRFYAKVPVGANAVAGATLLAFTNAKYGEAAKAVASVQTGAPPAAATEPTPQPPPTSAASFAYDYKSLERNVVKQDQESESSLPVWLIYGFLGGLILNLMPCVLPVIGLKVLSFVEQAGHDRGRILSLNIWYSLGMMSVFMVLATLAAVLGLGWGEQFGNDVFNIIMVGVVFAMALSFLGVWEIPIPGFIGSGKAGEAAAKEGVSGAFAKGVVTTILATPCTGPFLGVSLAWAVAQPPHLTYLLFGSVGLGMASPYLLIGAFPSLIRFLPKPGAWMETFKQIMGFVLLGTVIFFLTFINERWTVPTVLMMFGIWAGCWWIGRTPFTADFGVKLRAWMAGITSSALIGLIAFAWLAQGDNRHWQPYSDQAIANLTGQRKTVLVDFTADWCLVCQGLKKYVLDTPRVKQAVDSNQVEMLLADWTEGSENVEVTRMLEALKSKSVPVLAIFPAGKPHDPIIFRGPYTTHDVLEALKQAGPSQSPAEVAKVSVR